ncbi:MAG: magnesium/cobalt transporter CorA [Bacteroidota bacterium]
MNLNLKKKQKIDPKDYVFEGLIPKEEMQMQAFYYNADEVIEVTDFKPEQLIDFPDSSKNIWLNTHGIHETKQVIDLADKLGLHHLSIQDILDIHQRPKFQEFNDYFFFSIKSKFYDRAGEFKAEQMSFVLGENFLVSFQEKKGDHFTHLRERIRQNKGIVRERGTDYLLFLMLEAILDEYSLMIETFETDANRFELMEVNTDVNPMQLQQIENHKRKVQLIRKAIFPIKEFCYHIDKNDNNFINESNKKYFIDLKNYCRTLLDETEELRTQLEASINLFFSVQSHRMNQVMKTLTIVSTIFIPLTFIAGVYGMNFENMPELQWNYAYFLVLGIFVVIIIIMVAYFKRKKWF